jgi:hypothetical protein
MLRQLDDAPADEATLGLLIAECVVPSAAVGAGIRRQCHIGGLPKHWDGRLG